MDQCNVIELLGQASGSEAGEVFREFLRGGVRLMLARVGRLGRDGTNGQGCRSRVVGPRGVLAGSLQPEFPSEAAESRLTRFFCPRVVWYPGTTGRQTRRGEFWARGSCSHFGIEQPALCHRTRIALYREWVKFRRVSQSV